ncbi:MAG: protoglobin domain-containing protein [Planctomycetota bacterium]
MDRGAALERYEELRRYVGLADGDLRGVPALWELVAPHTPKLIDDFYATIAAHPRAAAVVTGGAAQFARLKGSLAVWIEDLFRGPWDADFVERRWRVGVRHVAIGLDPLLVHAAMSRIKTRVVGVLLEADDGDLPAGRRNAVDAVSRLLDLDLALVSEAYHAEWRKAERPADEKLTLRERAVARLAERALATSNLDELTDVTVAMIGESLGADAAAAFETVGGTERWRVSAGWGHEDFGVGGDFGRRGSGGFLDTVADTHGPVVVDDVRTAGGRPGRPSFPVPDLASAVAIALMPEAAGPGKLRVLAAFRTGRGRFGDDERRFLTSVGHIFETAIRRREWEERAALAERLAAIGQMMTRLTHESRNVLQRIRSSVELLGFELEDNPEATRLLERIGKAGGDLGVLYEEVRSYAAPLTLERSACDADELIREAWEAARESRPGDGSELASDLDVGLPPLDVDRFRVVQVFRNVFENAIAACAGSAHVTVTAHPSVADEASDSVDFLVRDDGPGIAEEVRATIFTPFVTTKAKGTGLGMAIAKRVVEAHGGTISAVEGSDERQPVDGTGAQFLVRLPTARR